MTNRGPGSLSSVLRELREQALLSQEQLAQQAGLSVGTVRGLESGRITRPRAVSIRQLAQVLAATAADEQRLIAATGRLPPSAHVVAALAVPAQLPRAIPGFVGRTAEMETLTATLELGMPVVSAITGPPGIGKTELAVHWGHTVADRFPDGQLYANLRGFGEDGPADPAAVACGFLEALSVPASQIPATREAQLGLFRSMLAGRRILVLLDNAHDAEQVRPLLAGANSIAVLVTSRSQLSGLVATAGARLVKLDPLNDAEARCLLRDRTGRTSIDAEPALSSIINRCAGLPLALSIVAARAITHPAFSLTDLAEELAADTSLNAFNGHDTATDVRMVFSWSYRHLSPDAARLFRLLGLHAGPDTCAGAAASLGAVSRDRAKRLLGELANAHLIAEYVPGRFTWHDLLHHYARELAVATDDPESRRCAQHRLLDYYLRAANDADAAFSMGRVLINLVVPLPGVVQNTLHSKAEAPQWFSRELPVLVAAVHHAAAQGFDSHAWQIAWCLAEYLRNRGRWHDWHRLHVIAADAAERAGDLAGQAHAHRTLARTSMLQGAPEAAHRLFTLALDEYTQLGNRRGIGYVHLGIAQLYETQRNYPQAVEHALIALAVHRQDQDSHGQGYALNNIGWYHALMGDYVTALTYNWRAIVLHRTIQSRAGLAYAWECLGYSYGHLGRYQLARACFGRALDILRQIEDPNTEAEVLSHLGDCELAAGRPSVACSVWRQARSIFAQLGLPAAAALDAKISGQERLSPPADPRDS